jgi:hypothetical protein
MATSHQGLRKWLTNVAVAVTSLLVGLACVESFFDDLQYEPERASEGWKRAGR